MSTFDLEKTGPTPLHPAVRPEGPATDPSMVVGLQRLAGNSAVAAAIKSGQIGADHGQLDIQRLADDEDEDEDESTEDTDTDTDTDAGAEAALEETGAGPDETGTDEDEATEAELEEALGSGDLGEETDEDEDEEAV